MTSTRQQAIESEPGVAGGWSQTAVALAQRLGQPHFARGDLAALRRMTPGGAPSAPAFWRLAARYELSGARSVEQKWALIIHGMALMTPHSAEGSPPRSAHDPNTSVGAALFHGGDSTRSTGAYSELRLNRLLMARGEILRTLLARMFRMLAANNATFDWREMARFILLDGFDERAAEQARSRIARDYYRAERRAQLAQERGP